MARLSYTCPSRPAISKTHEKVSVECPISIGIFDGFSWIRFEGKGSFMNSPALKAFGDSRIAAGESLLVVDLAACGGMDSTFMGTLAGLAARLSAVTEGRLHIASPGERNRRSLEDLGLDFVMDIDPPDAVWRGNLDTIRGVLHTPRSSTEINRQHRTRHVLGAHQDLSAINQKNARDFAGVVSALTRELAEKEKLAKEGGNI